jgi:hypothetical protein
VKVKCDGAFYHDAVFGWDSSGAALGSSRVAYTTERCIAPCGNALWLIGGRYTHCLENIF